MSNPVVSFLTTRNGYTFDEGVAVFAKYCRDKYAVERVIRSHNMAMLNNELKKLAHVPGLNDSDNVPKHEENVAKPVENVPKPAESVPKPAENVLRNDERNVTYADLKHHKYTRYEDMPTPETQQLWLRNNDRWHQKLDLFAKMKLMDEGDELAQVRNELVELSREHRDCWNLIDELCEKFYAEKDDPKQKPSFNVSTYRAYICKKLKCESLTDKQLVELQHRVNEMIAANVSLDEDTLKKLREKGISC